MKRSFHLFFLSVMVAAMFTIGACSSDDDNNTTGVPTTGSVSGTVAFTGTWPTTGDVQVSLYSNMAPPYIPMGPPDAFTNPIAGNPAQFLFALNGLDKGDYTALYVGWRDPQNPAGAQLIGMLWSDPNSSGIGSNGLPVAPPTVITIDAAKLNHTNLNMTADLDLIP